MYDFQPYDPATPRMVTSFKGNQKLIFEGYRYNIHHVVHAKGVKTWRCVCAKKLTSSRSWCKGRAETWDNDNQGISKGEHNHTPEHVSAEQEYFKSQLILAAISNPNVSLNDLIDEAVSYMSEAATFNSRESLKKSLTVARKSAENGGFKLKCYKSSEVNVTKNNNNNIANNNNNNQLQMQQCITNDIKMPEKLKDLMDLKLLEPNSMLSLLTLAHQQQQRQLQQQRQNAIETNNNNTSKNSNKNSSVAAAAAALVYNNNLKNAFTNQDGNSHNENDQLYSLSSVTSVPTTASIINQIVTSIANNNQNNGNLSYPGSSNISTTDLLLNAGLEFSLTDGSAQFEKIKRIDSNAMAKIRASGCGNSPASSSFNDSGLGISPNASLQHINARRKNAVSANFDLIQQLHNLQNSDNLANGRSTPTGIGINSHNLIQQQKKMARVNNIFNKLSNKAAAAASSTVSFTSYSNSLNNVQNVINCGSGSSQRNSPFSTSSSAGFDDNTNRNVGNLNFPLISAMSSVSFPQKQMISAETQTNASDFIELNTLSYGINTKVEDEVRLSSCIGENRGTFFRVENCGCRVIKVCCCSEETCVRRKRNALESWNNTIGLKRNSCDIDVLNETDRESHSPVPTEIDVESNGSNQEISKELIKEETF